MPGYIIHLAVAKEYIRNFRIKDEDEFLKGTIAPDLLATTLPEGKEKTHYSPTGGSQVNLKQFLKENKITSSYMEGYFLHLVVDYLFYNQYFTNFDTRLCNDYDKTNKQLIEKYNITIPDEIKDVIQFKEGKLEIIDIEKLNQMIAEISKKSIREYEKELKQSGTVTTNREDIKLTTTKRRKIELLILALTIVLICVIHLIFINQKEGYHCDEIFSYGSANSEYNNMFWSYNGDDGINTLVKEKIFNTSNILKIAKNLKYYFIDHKDEKDKYEQNVLSQIPKNTWQTKEEAENYVEAKDNRFNYISVYYNQVQDVHPPLFYMLVHTVSSVFNNMFSKYTIFFINLPFFIGTCIVIWKILNLIRKKIVIIIGCYSLWTKYRCNINNDVFENVYDVNIFYDFILIYKYKNI